MDGDHLFLSQHKSEVGKLIGQNKNETNMLIERMEQDVSRVRKTTGIYPEEKEISDTMKTIESLNQKLKKKNSEIKELKKLNGLLQEEIETLKKGLDDRGKHALEKRIKVLQAALSSVKKSNDTLFKENGKLNASELSKYLWTNYEKYGLEGKEPGNSLYTTETFAKHIREALNFLPDENE